MSPQHASVWSLFLNCHTHFCVKVKYLRRTQLTRKR